MWWFRTVFYKTSVKSHKFEMDEKFLDAFVIKEEKFPFKASLNYHFDDFVSCRNSSTNKFVSDASTAWLNKISIWTFFALLYKTSIMCGFARHKKHLLFSAKNTAWTGRNKFRHFCVARQEEKSEEFSFPFPLTSFHISFKLLAIKQARYAKAPR